MAVNVNESALDEGFTKARVLAPVVDEAVLKVIRQQVHEGTDLQLGRINAMEFAGRHHLFPTDVINALVACARGGIFEMQWSLTCPACGFFVDELPRLANVGSHFYCSTCDLQSNATLDSLVEVNFRLSDRVRVLDLSQPAGTPAADRYLRFKNPAAVHNPIFWAGIMGAVAGVWHAAPGETVEVPATLEAGGIYRSYSVTHGANTTVTMEPGMAGLDLLLKDGLMTVLRQKAQPTISVHNGSPKDAVGGVINKTKLMSVPFALEDRLKFLPVLSGRDLLCNQVFRDLFGQETLSAGLALQVESLTVLFTDLKGSTALYDQIGDLKAFGLVSEHFKILLGSVAHHGGAVVKTIGDAVMAAFPSADGALRSALEMASQLHTFNDTSGLPPLSLKIGLHAGPCIVVNSNQRLDYFGQTVNVAARVQGLAEGDEIVISEAAWGMPGVRSLAQAAGGRLTDSLETLKGVGEKVSVHTLQV